MAAIIPNLRHGQTVSVVGTVTSPMGVVLRYEIGSTRLAHSCKEDRETQPASPHVDFQLGLIWIQKSSQAVPAGPAILIWLCLYPGMGQTNHFRTLQLLQPHITDIEIKHQALGRILHRFHPGMALRGRYQLQPSDVIV